jgi:hypothetical protein
MPSLILGTLSVSKAWNRVIQDSNGITLDQLGRRKNDRNK